MGHQRLGEIPKSQKWQAVVERIAGGGGAGAPQIGAADPGISTVPEVAREILTAAEGGLAEVKTDAGFRYTLFLLTQIVLAARQADWQAALSSLGVALDADATVFDLTSEIHRTIEDHRRKHRGSVTIGEMAQQAAGEAVA